MSFSSVAKKRDLPCVLINDSSNYLLFYRRANVGIENSQENRSCIEKQIQFCYQNQSAPSCDPVKKLSQLRVTENIRKDLCVAKSTANRNSGTINPTGADK